MGSAVMKPDRQSNGRIAGFERWPSARVLEKREDREIMEIWSRDSCRGERGEKNGVV